MVLTATAPKTTVSTTPKMNKSELVAQVAERLGTSKAHAKRVIDAMLDVVIESLANDVKITLTGFGSFESRTYKARNGVNPRTGEKITIPATRRPVFVAGAPLKRAIKSE